MQKREFFKSSYLISSDGEHVIKFPALKNKLVINVYLIHYDVHAAAQGFALQQEEYEWDKTTGILTLKLESGVALKELSVEVFAIDDEIDSDPDKPRTGKP